MVVVWITHRSRKDSNQISQSQVWLVIAKMELQLMVIQASQLNSDSLIIFSWLKKLAKW